MLVDVTSVRPLPGFRLLLTFEDGKRGIYDVEPLLDKGVFRRLRNNALFNQVTVELGSVAWPGDLDIAPETLWEDCKPITDEALLAHQS